MKIHLLAIGQRAPSWVVTGYGEYAKRLPPACRLTLVELPTLKRSKNQSVARVKELEGERLLAAIPAGTLVVALDEHGKGWTTQQLSSQLSGWLQDGRDICLLVGGPDGLSAACLQRAEHHWSLSAMTLPHALVRIFVAEQIYRAWSLLHGHPYHRE